MRSRCIPGCVFGVLLTLSPLAVAANQVHTVGTGFEFASLQAAIDNAAEGDILLLKEGAFMGATIDGKSLVVIADDAAEQGLVKVVALAIKNIGVSQSVVIRGIEFSNPFLVGDRITVTDCAGTVVIDDCQAYSGGVASIYASNALALVISNCTVVGRSGINFTSLPGQVALFGQFSVVLAYDSVFKGGAGAPDSGPSQPTVAPPSAGGISVFLHSGFMFASGCLISGGKGGDVFSPTTAGMMEPDVCGAGGDAITLQAGATCRRLNSPLIPGAGGTSTVAGFSPGAPGLAANVIDGTLLVTPEFARHFEATSPVREGGTLTLEFTGQPNEPVYLLFSLGAHAFYSGGLQGALLPSFPVTFVPMGNLDATGHSTIPIALPMDILPPGVSGVPIYQQGMFAGAAGPILLSSPSVSVLLDDSL